MIREYKTIQEINGPLMVVRKVEGVTYDELGEIQLPNGDVRRCKVLEVNGDNAVVQLFESSAGINLKESRIRFLGHPLELAVSGDVSAAEVIRVPAPEDARLGAYVHHTNGMYKFGTFITGINVRSESVLGSDGYLYFVPDVRDENGELFSGELLPGGGWGVYRIPCDGGTLFVLIDMEGGLDMALLDLDTLSVTQTMRVLPASEMAAGFDKIQCDVSSDGIAFAWRNYAAGYSFDGERCEEVYSGSTRFEGLPERFADARFHGQGDVMDIACSGGRLAVLRRINVSPDEMPNSDYLERPYLLLIYGEDGLECADWLSTQLDSFWRINETACITEVEA